MHKTIASGVKYRADIDGLRGVAVAAVVAFHAFPTTLPGGFIGVDVFFVISGYLITGILMREAAAGQFSLLGFYERRIRRIFPALVVVLAACLAFGWFALLPVEYEQLGWHAVTGMLFSANLQLWTEAGYFDGAAMFKPLLHLWSLGIEEQFYIAWPVIIWLGLRFRIGLVWTVTALGLGSFAMNMIGVRTDPIATFYLPHTRAWELLVGAALAVAAFSPPAWLRWLPSGPVARNVAAIAGLGLIAFGLVWLTEHSSYPGWRALLPTLGAALLIWSEGALINRHLLSLKAMVWIGLISYPLYLWHWPLLSFARIVEGGEVIRYQRMALVALAVVLAAFTYRYVELPLRKGRLRPLSVPASVAAMLAVGVMGYAVSSTSGMENRPHVAQTAKAVAQFVGPAWKYMKTPGCVERYPLAGAESFGWWFCQTNSERPPEILLLGSSIANQIYPGLVSSPAFEGRSILNIGTCEPIWIDPEQDFGEEAYSPCSGNRALRQQELIDGILASGTIRYVLVAGLRETPDDAYIEAFRKRIETIERNGATAVVFTPYVYPPDYNIRQCFGRPFKSPAYDCQMPLDSRRAIGEGLAPLREHLAVTNPGVRFFDTNDLFCDHAGCSMIQDGMPMLRDELHWSEFASIMAANRLVEWAAVHEPGLIAASPH